MLNPQEQNKYKTDTFEVSNSNEHGSNTYDFDSSGPHSHIHHSVGIFPFPISAQCFHSNSNIYIYRCVVGWLAVAVLCVNLIALQTNGIADFGVVVVVFFCVCFGDGII